MYKLNKLVKHNDWPKDCQQCELYKGDRTCRNEAGISPCEVMNRECWDYLLKQIMED